MLVLPWEGVAQKPRRAHGVDGVQLGYPLHHLGAQLLLRVGRVAAVTQRGCGEADGAMPVAACPLVGHVRLEGGGGAATARVQQREGLVQKRAATLGEERAWERELGLGLGVGLGLGLGLG